MKKITLLLSAASAMILFLGSCSENSQFEGYTKAENGLYYKYFNHDENGVKSNEGDQAVLRYIFMNQKNDSIIMDSKNGSQDGSGYVNIGIRKATFKGSLEDALLMMVKGDSASFIVSADSFFLKTMGMNELPKAFQPGGHIKALIKMKDLLTKSQVEEKQKQAAAEQEIKMKEAEAKEVPMLEKYLADNNIKVKPTKGIYFIETAKGSGGFPDSTSIVKVHYTGKLLDGTKFDSSVDRGQPVEFPLNQVIRGWTRGLQMMKKGSKATLILPSSLAYGPQGGGPIPPYAPLVFEVELIDFKAAPIQPAGVQGQPQGQGH
jgi:FKBP-type peptidyl-prolyl cis-trans isomerase